MDVVAFAQRAPAVLGAGVPGERDGGYGPHGVDSTADLPDERISVLAAHPDVAHEHVRRAARDCGVRRRDRFHRDHGGTVLREDGHDEITRVIGVLHHEHAYAVERAETRRRVAVARRPGRRHLVRRGLVGKPNGQRDGE